MAEGEEQWRQPCTSQCTGDSVAFLVSGGSEDMPSTGAPLSASSPPQVIANKADSVQAAAHSSAFTASRLVISVPTPFKVLLGTTSSIGGWSLSKKVLEGDVIHHLLTWHTVYCANKKCI